MDIYLIITILVKKIMSTIFLLVMVTWEVSLSIVEDWYVMALLFQLFLKNDFL
jgi:hypothetical protein